MNFYDAEYLDVVIPVGFKTGEEGLYTIEASKKPIAFTHTSPRVLCDTPRNKTDEELKALARKGGVGGTGKRARASDRDGRLRMRVVKV